MTIRLKVVELVQSGAKWWTDANMAKICLCLVFQIFRYLSCFTSHIWRTKKTPPQQNCWVWVCFAEGMALCLVTVEDTWPRSSWVMTQAIPASTPDNQPPDAYPNPDTDQSTLSYWQCKQCLNCLWSSKRLKPPKPVRLKHNWRL